MEQFFGVELNDHSGGNNGNRKQTEQGGTSEPHSHAPRAKSGEGDAHGPTPVSHMPGVGADKPSSAVHPADDPSINVHAADDPSINVHVLTEPSGGSTLWACKLSSKAKNCPNGATTLSFTNSKNIRVEGLMSLNSQMFHSVINGCQDVLIQGVKVIAAGNSPNTDGIHVQFSRNVAIFDTSIKTGDDCVSIGPGTKDLWMERKSCGPGHGINIGSLAKDLEEEGVQNVTVKTAIFKGTQNSLRIRSWARPSSGFVQGVRFLDVEMLNVQNPIVIDQNYCPHNLINCPGQVSGVKVGDVLYQNIRGTSATVVAIKFDCSAENPCSGVRLENVNLTCRKQVVQSYCTNVNGKKSKNVGTVQPNSCL
ncbi:hypothetical protein M0R45_005294 [Rubus argutus]|uniref:Polygalacturonase-like n=1 Tax=Rubus argutus TaxID=59490 RepID=A0AAW1YMT2_RUBAR